MNKDLAHVLACYRSYRNTEAKYSINGTHLAYSEKLRALEILLTSLEYLNDLEGG